MVDRRDEEARDMELAKAETFEGEEETKVGAESTPHESGRSTIPLTPARRAELCRNYKALHSLTFGERIYRGEVLALLETADDYDRLRAQGKKESC